MKNEKGLYEKIITKPELNFWLPIIISIISIVISFMTLSGKVDLLVQKQDTMNEKIDKLTSSFESARSIVMKNSQRISVLETQIATIMK